MRGPGGRREERAESAARAGDLAASSVERDDDAARDYTALDHAARDRAGRARRSR